MKWVEQLFSTTKELRVDGHWYLNGEQLSPEAFYALKLEEVEDAERKEHISGMLDLIKVGVIRWTDEVTLEGLSKLLKS
jgi:hypothetical protein